MCAHLDATAVKADKEIYPALARWNTLTGQDCLMMSIDSLQDQAASEKLKNGLRHSKLSYLSEGGGKTRTIAIADYWTQSSLRNLHKWAMRCLRQLKETDSTYSHE